MKLLGGGVSGVEDFGPQFEQVDPNARIEMEDTSFNGGCCVGAEVQHSLPVPTAQHCFSSVIFKLQVRKKKKSIFE